MSLKSKYRTDPVSVRDGVWFPFDANSDGTVPRFKIGYAGKANKVYTSAMRKLTEKYAGDSGLPDFDSLTEEAATELTLSVFVDTLLLEWENFQPEDDGVVVPYTKEAALEIFRSEDWSPLYSALDAKARKVANFAYKSLQAQAKN